MQLEPIQKLGKDIKEAAKTLSISEVRFLVDNYYQIQEYRKGAFNQERSLIADNEPHEIITWYAKESERLEKEIRKALDVYSNSQPIGIWSREICGIGPVIAAGLLGHIDITKCPTVGHIWSFAGLDPTKEWKKGEKRPFNASLKTLCWKIGESFVKVSSNKNDIYGQYYIKRKEQEIAKNENLEFKDQAEAKLKKFNIGKKTDAYKNYSKGKLPPAHIHARAKRYAVKLFLSHWHEQAYRHHFNEAPPLPYPIAILNHAHKI